MSRVGQGAHLTPVPRSRDGVRRPRAADGGGASSDGGGGAPLVGGPSAAAHACELRTPVRWLWRRTGAVHESAGGARERERGGLRWRGPAAAVSAPSGLTEVAAAAVAAAVTAAAAEKQASEGRPPTALPTSAHLGDGELTAAHAPAGAPSGTRCGVRRTGGVGATSFVSKSFLRDARSHGGGQRARRW